MGNSREHSLAAVPRRRRRLRPGKALRVGLGLIVVSVVALVAALHLYDFNQYKGLVTARVKEVTGRQLRIEGDLDLAFSPGPVVVVTGVNFANARWGSRFDMVKVARLEAEIALLPLIIGKVQVKRLVLVEPDILLETDNKRRGNWKLDIKDVNQLSQGSANRDIWALDIPEVRVERAHITYRDGVSGQSKDFTIKDMSLRTHNIDSPISLNLVAIYDSKPIYLSGSFGTLKAFIEHTSFPVMITATADDMAFTLNTTMARDKESKLAYSVDRLWATLKTAKMEVHLDKDQLIYRDRRSGKTVKFGIRQLSAGVANVTTPVSIDIAASYQGTDVAVSGTLGALSTLLQNKPLPIKLAVKTAGIKGVVKGSIGEPLKGRGVNLVVDLRGDSLARLSKLTGIKLPPLGPVHVTANVVDGDGTYVVNDLQASLEAGDMKVRVTGSIKRPLEARGVNLTVSINAKARKGKSGNKMKPRSPVQLSAKVFDAKGGYVVKDITGIVTVGASQFSIDDKKLTYHNRGSRRTMKLGVRRLSVGIKGVDSPISLDLGATYNGQPVDVSGTLGKLSDLVRNRDLSVKLALKSGDANATFAGSIIKPLTRRGVNLIVDMQAGTLASLSEFLGLKLPAIAPVEFKAELVDVSGAYLIKDIHAKVGKSDLSGEITVAFASTRPNLSGRLTSNLLDLAELLPKKEPQKQARIFSAEPLPLDALRVVDADVMIKANRVRTRGLVLHSVWMQFGPEITLENVTMGLKLEAGRLSINPATAELAGGTVRADMVLDASGQTPILSSNLVAKQIEVGQLEQVKKEDFLTGGKTDIRINVSGRGNSVRSVMAGLNGELLVVMGEGRIKNTKVDLIGADLLIETIRMMSSSTEEDDFTDLRCGVLHFYIKDGIATTDKGIAAQTGKMNLIGSGVINLKTEELEIRIHPKARKGLGIGAGTLAQLVRVGGTLAEPKPEPDPVGVLKTGASIGAAVFTSGLSLLAEGLFRHVTVDKSPCVTAQKAKSDKVASAANRNGTNLHTQKANKRTQQAPF